MPEKFEFAEGVFLGPGDATRMTTIIGQRDSGKTYAGMKLVEGFSDLGVPVIVFDPVGVWWGLTVEGEGAPLNLPVFGGNQGDMPLEVSYARPLAELLVESNYSAVLDLSLFTRAKKGAFVTNFCEEFIVQTARHKSPRLAVFDEIQMLVPQNGKSAASEVIIELGLTGRNYGTGMLLSSQRCQAVDKDVLTQSSLCVAGRMQHPRDIAAAREWLGDDLKGIKSLERGHMFVSSLEGGEANLTKVLPKRSRDTSSTPTLSSDTFRRPTLFDMVEIKRLLESAVGTPQRTHTSQREDSGGTGSPQIKVVTKEVKVPVVPAAYTDAVARTQTQLAGIQEDLRKLTAPESTPPKGDVHVDVFDEVLFRVQQFESLSVEEVAVILGLPSEGGDFRRELKRLLEGTNLTCRGGAIVMTGPAPVPEVERSQLPSRAVSRWRPQLPKAQWVALRRIVEDWPHRLSIDDVAKATGYSPKSSKIRDAPGVLRKLKLLEPRRRRRELIPCRVLQVPA